MADTISQQHSQETAQFLAAIVDSSDDAIISKNLDGVVTSWNLAAERIFGYTAKEMIGQHIALLIPLERRDEEPAILERIRRGEPIDHYETIRQRKDGSLIEISLTVSPIRNLAGKIVGASKIARDITEQRRTEERIRAAEEQFRITLSSIGDAVISTDDRGRVVFMNPVAERVTGWAELEAREKPLAEVFHIVNEQTRLPVENPVERVMREGMIVGLANHTILISRQGEEHSIADSAAPIRDRTGRLVGAVLCFRDVTMERQTGLGLARLAAIIESSDDAIISKDLRGIITSWNRGAQEIFGYTSEEMVGQSLLRLFPAGRHGEEEQILALIQRGERVDHFETIRLRKDGRPIHVSVTISPIRDADGEIVGASKIARDISIQKHNERALLEAQEQLRLHAQELERKVGERTAELRETVGHLESFSYNISHDLRAPLRAMQGFAQVTLDEYGPKLDAQGTEYLSRIVTAGSRLDRLIQDVLSSSHLSAGSVPLHPVNLQQLVNEIISDYPVFQPPQADITVEAPLCAVMGHEAFLTQCISNLLGNAVKFVSSRQQPKVRLSAEKRGTNVRLWIEDNGIGIPAEHQPRIFGLFERAHNDKAYEGTGIGLSIVRKAVERMGGTLGVESQPGMGSRFWIELAGA